MGLADQIWGFYNELVSIHISKENTYTSIKERFVFRTIKKEEGRKKPLSAKKRNTLNALFKNVQNPPQKSSLETQVRMMNNKIEVYERRGFYTDEYLTMLMQYGASQGMQEKFVRWSHFSQIHKSPLPEPGNLKGLSYEDMDISFEARAYVKSEDASSSTPDLKKPEFTDYTATKKPLINLDDRPPIQKRILAKIVRFHNPVQISSRNGSVHITPSDNALPYNEKDQTSTGSKQNYVEKLDGLGGN